MFIGAYVAALVGLAGKLPVSYVGKTGLRGVELSVDSVNSLQLTELLIEIMHRALRDAFGAAEKMRLIGAMGLVLCAESKIKCRPLADFRFGPDGAAVAAHNSFHRRQSDACSFEVLGPMQSLKNAE